MQTTQNYTVIGAGHGGKSDGRPPGADGVPRDPVQSHPRTRGCDQGPPRDRPGELRGRAARLRPAGSRHVRHGGSAGEGRGRACRGAFFGPRRGRQGRGPAPARWTDRRAASRPHPGRHRVRQDAQRSGLQSGGHCRGSRHIHLRQPLRWPGPGAHLPHQGCGAVGRAAGHAHGASPGSARAGLPAVHRRDQRAAHRARQHGRHLPSGPDPAQRGTHRVYPRRL